MSLQRHIIIVCVLYCVDGRCVCEWSNSMTNCFEVKRKWWNWCIETAHTNTQNLKLISKTYSPNHNQIQTKQKPILKWKKSAKVLKDNHDHLRDSQLYSFEFRHAHISVKYCYCQYDYNQSNSFLAKTIIESRSRIFRGLFTW